MFTITCEKFKTSATTSDINVCKGITFSLLEAIGQDGGILTVSDGQTTITALYIADSYVIDGDHYSRLYEASESMAYRIQEMEG